MADRVCLPVSTRVELALFALIGLLGPGLIAANAGNDAGGIATYSSVGAKYGYDLLWTIVLITISLAIVQLLAARMGVVTGKGLAELVREEYGIRWSVLATSAVLIANLGICISDFVGVGAALGLAGHPAAGLGADRRRRHLADHRARLLPLGRAHLHLVHDPVLRLPDRRDPRAPQLGRRRAARSSIPRLHTNSTYLLLLIATIGTTITPYMQQYLQSAIVDRGVREEDLRHEEVEAVSGSVFAYVISAFIIIATGATLYTHGVHEIGSAADAARALTPFAGHFAELLFGVGLLGASLLAAAILPIATSYVVSESLGYEKGIGRRREEAPVFVGIITAMIALSAIVAVIPGVPVISLLVAVQVVNGLLLPINLFFIWRLSRSHALMGEHRSRGLLDGATGLTVVLLSALSIVLVIVTVAGI